jgi:hypothetical protein
LGGQDLSLLPRIQELLGMTPSRLRRRYWPAAALPAAGIIALVTSAAGLSQDHGTVASPDGSRPLPATYGPLTAPRAPLPDRQISFEVRFIKLSTEPWRELLKDRLKLVQQEADVSAWIVDKKSLVDLLNHSQSDVTSNILQAPKVTTFENDRATISFLNKQDYVARVDKVDTAGLKGFRPTVMQIDVGWRGDFVGSYLPDGMNVSVDVRHSDLMAMHTLTRKERFGAEEVVGTYQVPSLIEHRCQVACAVPDDSSLVISLGIQVNETPIFAGVTEVAGKFLESMGLPRREAKTVTCERLTVITPRKIVLEAEEERIGIPTIKGGFGDNRR